MKHDLGHEMTEEQLLELEKRIAKTYREARNGLDKTITEYFANLRKRDEHQLALLEKGEITEEQYKQWRLNQIGRGKRYEALRDEIAKRYTEANQVAVSYVNDATPGIYSLNRNYAAYTIEQEIGNVGFTLWDEQTVKRLIVEEPDLMPYYPKKKAVKRGIDLAWGKQQITASVTSGILQGHSVGKIANDLQDRIENMNRSSALRTARTAITGAQNAGRMDSYAAAEKMGIQIEKEWLATLDNRTRHSHAMLDGERVSVNGKFSNGCKFPGDPDGKPWEVYNCRCTMVSAIKGIDTSDGARRARSPETGEWETFYGNYQEWAAAKKININPTPKRFTKQVKSSTIEMENLEVPAPKKNNNAEWNSLLDDMQAKGVEYKTAMRHAKQPTLDEIISSIAGGDNTRGSCASVGVAYIGQTCGVNVLDFRGGASMSWFSSKINKLKLWDAVGAKYITENSAKSNLTNGKRILARTEKGKEYYLSVGGHAAIVRAVDNPITDPVTGEVKKVGTKYQYLELQHPTRNGWVDFSSNITDTLRRRFGCSSSGRYWPDAYITDIEQLKGNEDFLSVLGYINTNESEQRKGTHGTIK